jgi:hypothetical protein
LGQPVERKHSGAKSAGNQTLNPSLADNSPDWPR